MLVKENFKFHSFEKHIQSNLNRSVGDNAMWSLMLMKKFKMYKNGRKMVNPIVNAGG